MSFFNDIWNEIMPNINWAIFILVIASGYFVRVTPILNRCSTTLKVLIFSLSITVLYGFASNINLGVFIVSYFSAFGFHSAIIKLIERYIKNKINK